MSGCVVSKSLCWRPRRRARRIGPSKKPGGRAMREWRASQSRELVSKRQSPGTGREKPLWWSLCPRDSLSARGEGVRTGVVVGVAATSEDGIDGAAELHEKRVLAERVYKSESRVCNGQPINSHPRVYSELPTPTNSFFRASVCRLCKGASVLIQNVSRPHSLPLTFTPHSPLLTCKTQR